MQRILSLVKTISAVTLPARTFTAVPSIISSLQCTREKLLVPQVTMLNTIRNFKIKGRVRRRCKSCYIVVRDERMYVMCPKFPRHKQMSMKPKPHNTWMLTHATQSKIRPW